MRCAGASEKHLLFEALSKLAAHCEAALSEPEQRDDHELNGTVPVSY